MRGGTSDTRPDAQSNNLPIHVQQLYDESKGQVFKNANYMVETGKKTKIKTT